MGFTLSIILTSLLIFVLAGVACRQPTKVKPNDLGPAVKPASVKQNETPGVRGSGITVELQTDGTPVPGREPVGVARSSGKRIPRAEIAERLRRLAKSTTPDIRQIVAMCYDMAAPPMRAEYVCPVCGAKTIYAAAESEDVFEYFPGNESINKVRWTIESCRRNVPLIKGLAVELDETQFCKNCSPDIETPKLGLVITYEDGSVHKVWGIESKDVELIKAFMAGEKTVGAPLDEKPLKDYTNRLEELLGVKIDIPSPS